MAFVRSSKFRHVFGTPAKKDLCYDNIKVTKSPHESNMCAVNKKFVAVVLESQGGGAFMVAPITEVGRFDINYPKVSGHKNPVLDIAWNPFNDVEIASCSEDCTIKIWVIPEGGLKEVLATPKCTLSRHQRKVLYVCWHPSASDVLMSASADHNIMLWDVSSGEDLTQPFKTISVHPDMIHSVSWNYNGSFIATSCKDKKIRVINARSGEVMREGKGHDGNKPSKVVFCGRLNKIFSSGFSRMSERQYALWNPLDLGKALTLQNTDTSSGVQFPFWDEGTGMVYLVGKGDTTIRYFEVTEKSPYVFFLSMYQAKQTARGAGIMPKRELDFMKCEVMRFYRLSAMILEPVAMTVPRKSEMFQDDIYPPCAAGTPALTAEEWCGGADKDPKVLEFTQDGLKETTIESYKNLDFSASGKKATSPAASGAPRTLEEYKVAYEKLLKENASLKAQLAKN